MIFACYRCPGAGIRQRAADVWPASVFGERFDVVLPRLVSPGGDEADRPAADRAILDVVLVFSAAGVDEDFDGLAAVGTGHARALSLAESRRFTKPRAGAPWPFLKN